ncbi:MAG: flagellar hook-basal body complex protein FliE [Firmicutes bacterium]|nr:flagellar hook-basal body complex protein FliE [Bacillota bacterium]
MHINPYIVPLPPVEKGTKKAPAPITFGDFFRDALQNVNRQQLEAEASLEGIFTGEAEDLHQVMIATEKARLSLQLTVQFTNKVIEAYKEISRMQI